jgi:hypothetical protein
MERRRLEHLTCGSGVSRVSLAPARSGFLGVTQARGISTSRPEREAQLGRIPLRQPLRRRHVHRPRHSTGGRCDPDRPHRHGNSYLPEVLARILDMQYFFDQCFPGTREEDLLVKMLPSENTVRGIALHDGVILQPWRRPRRPGARAA